MAAAEPLTGSSSLGSLIQNNNNNKGDTPSCDNHHETCCFDYVQRENDSKNNSEHISTHSNASVAALRRSSVSAFASPKNEATNNDDDNCNFILFKLN